MGKFGWSYPAGCDGPPDDDCRCEICGKDAGLCVCPECLECGMHGDPRCYVEHGLKGRMQSVTIRDNEMVAVMDALSQYLDNAAVDDNGEPDDTPDYRAVRLVLDRLEAAFVASRLDKAEGLR